MPIYEYRCNSCGHQLEVIQKISDTPLEDCDSCGESALRKLISPVGFRLKGSGWYETDFKTGDKKKNLAGGDDKPAEKKSDADGNKKEAKTEKPAAKTDTESKSKSVGGSSGDKAA